jgi:RNA methyltransferase, TrmH family
VEGVRLLDEALASGCAVEPILYAPERLSATAAGRALRRRLDHVPGAEEIDGSVLEALSDTVNSQGVVAAAAIPHVARVPATGYVLVLDGLADPGNAGTMLRTARAAGVSAVLATVATTDLWSPKAVRAGMGAHFHVPLIADVDWAALPSLVGERQILLAGAREGVPYWEVDWSQPTAIVVGSEAHGPSAAAAGLATSRVSIPMAKGAESLNAAAAAAVLLFAAYRRR